ncbi:hypothetical protein ElyMa_003592200 [Elysia marginata]|uniref:Uncharacterized protein n=1 Tax=Elysia marginata TaxID=1093978 RepID=A0AAV4EPC1_9GAST|nr:hypothetical protein ElyMa_003592200 [Elysia marginata]
MSTIKKYPYFSTCGYLVAAVRGTQSYGALANANLDTRTDKLWSLVRDYVAPPDDSMDLMAMIHSLPNNLPNTLTPTKTIGLSNA